MKGKLMQWQTRRPSIIWCFDWTLTFLTSLKWSRVLCWHVKWNNNDYPITVDRGQRFEVNPRRENSYFSKPQAPIEFCSTSWLKSCKLQFGWQIIYAFFSINQIGVDHKHSDGLSNSVWPWSFKCSKSTFIWHFRE